MRKITFLTFYIVVLQFFFICESTFSTNYYVDSQWGSDGNNGTTGSTPWKTIDRVNMVSLIEGDAVYFKKDGIYRGTLLPKSGTSSNRIIYSSYGGGTNKPKFFASFQRNSVSDWQEEVGGNLWSTGYKPASLSGIEKLLNPSFATNTADWNFYSNTVVSPTISATFSRSTNTNEYYDVIGGGGKITCVNNGNSATDIQYSTNGFDIKAATWYKLTFFARASANFSVPIKLIKNGSPYTDYVLTCSAATVQFKTGDWTSYEVYIQTNYTTDIANSADKARITFQLGNALPDGGSLFLDSFSIRECNTPPEFIVGDVGNVILGNEDSCGIKVWNKVDLNVESEFWFDENLNRLFFYTTHGNPASYYSNIELATKNPNISAIAKSYINIENLDLRYGGGGGIYFSGYKSGSNYYSPNSIIIRDVDISYIGGAKLSGTTRAGNGIQFWDGATNIIVERCRISQIYDSGISPQGSLDDHICQNFYFRNNIFDKCEQSFEMWQKGTSSLSNVYFENNTCMNAGFGWSHSQRPDPNGVHILLWGFSSTVTLLNIQIRNNVFYNVANYGIYSHWADDINKINIDYNCWYPGGSAPLLRTNYLVGSIIPSPTSYSWTTYRSTFSDDAYSILANPLLINDSTLSSDSPCRDIGLTVSTVTHDFNNIIRPQGIGYDIGAFEYVIPPLGVPAIATDIEAIVSNNNLIVTSYPNPATDYISLKFKNFPNTPVQLLLISLDGKVIHKETIYKTEAGLFHLNFKQKPSPGLYLLKVVWGKFTNTIPVSII